MSHLESSDIPERMRIGDLAQRAGVSHRTIHYYEEEGLLSPIEREAGGHRQYSPQALARLHKIKQLQEIGLTLDEIRTVIDLYFEEPTGIKGKRKVLEVLETQLTETERKIAELQSFREDLTNNISRIQRLIEDIEQQQSD